jgi:excisionase family DNA binding protein
MSDTQLIALTEDSAYLRIPSSTIYKLPREGTLPAQKIGRNWQYHKDVLDDWLKGKMLTNTTN